MSALLILLAATEVAEKASSEWYNSLWIFIPLLILVIILAIIISSNSDEIDRLESDITAKKVTEGLGHVVGYGKHLFGM